MFGVPVTTPPVLMDRPAGSPVEVHVYGATLSVAVNTSTYGVPAVAGAHVSGFVMAGGVEMTVVFESAEPHKFVTRTQ
jgi:hypothetical protein